MQTIVRVDGDVAISASAAPAKGEIRAVECPSDIVDAIGGWKTAGVGHGYGEGYTLEVLNRWILKIE